jgi:hypothetical protein
VTTQRQTQHGTDGGRRRGSYIVKRGLLLLLVALTLHACALTAAAQQQEKLTKLSPEPLAVQLQGGSGTADFYFALAPKTPLPEYKVTDAVGNSNTIPAEKGQITFQWIDPPPTPDESHTLVLTGRLTVKTKVFVEPNVNYSGRIIFMWADAAPQPVGFSASDKTTLALSLSPAKLDLTLLQDQPDSVVIRVKNTGRAAIGKLTLSSSDLFDTETRRRLGPTSTPVEFKDGPLAPSREAEVAFTVPHAVWAGNYLGTLDVTANDDGGSRQSIPVVLQSRGPTPTPSMFWLPYVLFFVTLLFGALLSYWLENWFNLGGLQRAEALLSLQRSGEEFSRVTKSVEELAKGHPEAAFAQTKLRLRQDTEELAALFRRHPTVTRDDLTAEAKRFATSATLYGVFETAVGVALRQWEGKPDRLNSVLTSLDRVAPGTDPVAYRASLRKVLEDAAAADQADNPNADEADTFDADEALPDVPPPADLERKIRSMAMLERGVAAVLVFIGAYLMFFARDFTFGTLPDYFGVFLWSLGLTQTGTQIISRARSSVTPTR